MEAGAEMQELLGDSQRIYSSDDKKDEIQKIALQEGFSISECIQPIPYVWLGSILQISDKSSPTA